MKTGGDEEVVVSRSREHAGPSHEKKLAELVNIDHIAWLGLAATHELIN